MPWHNSYFYLLQATSGVTTSNLPKWEQIVLMFAPLLSFGAALANLLLAMFIFRFTKKKNNSDRNIKWFQELIFNPSKEVFFSHLKSLDDIKNHIPQKADLSEEEKIALMSLIKDKRNNFCNEFIDSIKAASPDLHNIIIKAVDDLTDDLTKSFDNDELKWNNEKTIQKEIIQKVTTCKNNIVSAIFNYKG